jgi:hypothetical protein
VRKRKTTKKKKQPVRVTHTHEVIRQVQQENTMAANETKKETTKGYSGVPGEEGYPAPKYATNLPEGSVISPLGVTRPPEPGILDPYRKERSDDEQLAGKVLIKGKTHHGFKYERIVDIQQPRTELGMFQVFKAHFPDAVDEDFSAEPISDEDAEKLEKKWADELRGKEKDARDKKAKEYEEGTAKSAKEKEKNG